MALSNIFREPRREITESVVGIVVLCAVVWADLLFGRWVHTASEHHTSVEEGMVMGVIIVAAAIVAVTWFLLATHALGDAICNGLQNVGIHLRPRQRR
jgi:hypothetical protein